MGYLKLMYCIAGKSSPGLLYLDLTQRWRERTVMHAIVKYEFPAFQTERMRGEEWTAKRVAERFGITNLRYAYAAEKAEETQ